MRQSLTPIILILAGLFAIAGGALNWDWFMEDRKARFFTGVLGRNGARIFYIGLGVLMLVLALFYK